MKTYLSTFLAVVAFSLPAAASAQGLVPCDGFECGTCDLVRLANNIISFLISILTVLAMILIAVTGFKLATSQGNSSAYNEAKEMFTSLIIGLTIMICAWLIVDTVMKTFIANNGVAGNTQFGPWNTIPSNACTVQVDLEDGYYTQFFEDWELVGTINLIEDDNDGSIVMPAINMSGVTQTDETVCFSPDACFNKIDVPNSGNYAYADASHLGYERPGFFIDLQQVDPDTQISENFTVGELAQLYKGQYAYIDPELPGRLENVRNNLGSEVIINSGYRSPGYNSRLEGAAEHSRHQYGDAVDIALNGRSAADVVRSCRASGATFTKTYNSHVHCDWR